MHLRYFLQKCEEKHLCPDFEIIQDKIMYVRFKFYIKSIFFFT